jgi:ADP-ribose 1''-phosphate phosphatase
VHQGNYWYQVREQVISWRLPGVQTLLFSFVFLPPYCVDLASVSRTIPRTFSFLTSNLQQVLSGYSDNMSSQRVSTITSYFAPNGEAKQPPKAARPISPPPTSRPSQQPEKAKGKRPTSGSPAPIPLKKQDTKGSNKISPKHLSHKDLPSNWASPNTASARKLTLSYQNGDIFDAPPNTLLIHACNTQGAWGGGIAIPFKSKYPKAYTIYNTFCTKEHLLKSRPVPTGTALLIPPADRQGHWIGCL